MLGTLFLLTFLASFSLQIIDASEIEGGVLTRGSISLQQRTIFAAEADIDENEDLNDDTESQELGVAAVATWKGGDIPTDGR